MCKCTPSIRTPWCGKPGCEAPKQKQKEPVLCINCEHHAVVAFHHHHCLSAINLVTGERGEAMCWEMRRANEACGPAGKLFQPKQP